MKHLQDCLNHLMNHYEQDLEIYRQILLETEKMQTRWSEETQHSESPFSVGVASRRPTMEIADAVAAEIVETEAAVQAADQAINETEKLIAWRREKLRDIDQRRGEADTLSKAACAELGVDTLNADVIQRVCPQLADRWRGILTEMQEKGTRVKESNDQLVKQLKMEMEYLKLEMHRMQGLQRSRQAYGVSPGMKEARFIDKNR